MLKVEFLPLPFHAEKALSATESWSSGPGHMTACQIDTAFLCSQCHTQYSALTKEYPEIVEY